MDAVLPDVSVVPVRTPTLPPATHTNTWIVGRGAMTVVDPASPYEDEQGRLFAEVSAAIDGGRAIRRLFLTHHHHDHVSGAVDLQRRLAARGVPVPIAAHPVTRELVAPAIRVDELVQDGDEVAPSVFAVFTPGHAPGHLALHHRVHGWVVAGDLVAGVGTIVIDPTEGDLQDYLDSLERIRALQPRQLLPAHGPVLEHGETVLSFYVAHRNQRSQQVQDALNRLGKATPLELAPWVYPELPRELHPLAAAQILTHLQWLRRYGLAQADAEGTWATP
jgi:endoribonuclease LACTB2